MPDCQGDVRSCSNLKHSLRCSSSMGPFTNLRYYRARYTVDDQATPSCDRWQPPRPHDNVLRSTIESGWHFACTERAAIVILEKPTRLPTHSYRASLDLPEDTCSSPHPSLDIVATSCETVTYSSYVISDPTYDRHPSSFFPRRENLSTCDLETTLCMCRLLLMLIFFEVFIVNFSYLIIFNCDNSF